MDTVVETIVYLSAHNWLPAIGLAVAFLFSKPISSFLLKNNPIENQD